MNASEKRILKLAIILFTIGLIVRYLPWGLPSIESFEVGDAVVVANVSPGTNPEISPGTLENEPPSAMALADSAIILNKINPLADSSLTENLDDSSAVERHDRHRKPKKKVELPLHINTASADDLCALKGVGPKLAEKIIVRRNTFGPFKGPSDLKKVQGIGKKKLEMMLQSIIFD